MDTNFIFLHSEFAEIWGKDNVVRVILNVSINTEEMWSRDTRGIGGEGEIKIGISRYVYTIHIQVYTIHTNTQSFACTHK